MMLTRRQLLLATLASASLLPACSRGSGAGSVQPIAPGASVLALGDSLTYGTGATPATSYPSVLAGITGWQITNAGVPGNSAAEALARLPALLEAHNPELVLVSIGGNDFLRRLPEADTRRDVLGICELALASRAQVLLIAIPNPAFWLAAMTGSFSDHPLYADLAGQLKLPLQRGAWSEVLANPALRSDNIHANSQGYARFAQLLAETARDVGLLGA